jgi:hypothetical protein
MTMANPPLGKHGGGNRPIVSLKYPVRGGFVNEPE